MVDGQFQPVQVPRSFKVSMDVETRQMLMASTCEDMAELKHRLGVLSERKSELSGDRFRTVARLNITDGHKLTIRQRIKLGRWLMVQVVMIARGLDVADFVSLFRIPK
jgi:hypothetical protein